MLYKRRRNIPRPKANKAKLRELILYIAFKSEADERFGKLKLYKLLFKSDFLSFLRFGQPITGYEYQALGLGPAPMHIKTLLDAMQKSAHLVIRPRDFYGQKQHRPIPLRAPNIEGWFTPKEISLVDELIKANWEKTGSEMSDDSHTFTGWKFAVRNGTIPYSMALVSKKASTHAVIEHAKSLEEAARQCLERDAS